ncbi:PilZ domain-containing protein [Thalassobaculum sp.]|uniref:PilZ domain-containing protein n=1 Tax=Thalassobaculum sp. TaxID=2022740 RepID=UPI003B58BBDF
MSSEPPTLDDMEDGPPQGERRHANRVQIEGYEFETEAGAYPVLDLSIGGIRLARLPDQPAPEPGDTLTGTLSGGIADPITLSAQVLWVDAATGHIGCSFPVLGRHIASELLEILL